MNEIKGSVTAFDAFLITAVCLFSTGHWGGGLFMACMCVMELLAMAVVAKQDVTGRTLP